MLATMMDRPLLISSLLWHAENVFADRVGGVSCDAGRGDREFTYRDLGAATRRFAGAFDDLGIGFGTRVATLAWNTFGHLVAYYAVPRPGGRSCTLSTTGCRPTTSPIRWTRPRTRWS